MGRAESARGIVLVVDDDLDVRDALTTMLEDAGYETISVRDGRMALDYLRSHQPPDLILLDMMMPAMSGFEFWSTLKKESKLAAAPIIVVSADRFVGQRWVDAGIAAFITKPVQTGQLLSTVETTLKQSRRTQPPAHADAIPVTPVL